MDLLRTMYGRLWKIKQSIAEMDFGIRRESDMDAKTIQTIEAILRRGNDAKVRRKGGGYVVIEIKETIKSSPPAIGAGEGQ